MRFVVLNCTCSKLNVNCIFFNVNHTISAELKFKKKKSIAPLIEVIQVLGMCVR